MGTVHGIGWGVRGGNQKSLEGRLRGDCTILSRFWVALRPIRALFGQVICRYRPDIDEAKSRQAADVSRKPIHL